MFSQLARDVLAACTFRLFGLRHYRNVFSEKIRHDGASCLGAESLRRRIYGNGIRTTTGAPGSNRHVGDHRAVRGGGRNALRKTYSRSGECFVPCPLFYFDQSRGRDGGGAPDAGPAVRRVAQGTVRRRRSGCALENGLPLLVRLVRGV